MTPDASGANGISGTFHKGVLTMFVRFIIALVITIMYCSLGITLWAVFGLLSGDVHVH